MSTISGSGSGQDEVARRNREEYQNQEAALVKKHNKEIRRLNEAHMQELEQVRVNHEKQVQNLQKQSTQNVSRRDAQYQNQINQIRKMHTEQVGKIKAEHQRQIEAERKHNRSNEQNIKVANADRMRGLKDHYESTLQKKEVDYMQNVQRARENQIKAVEENRNKLNNKHEFELEQLSDNFRKEKSDIQYRFNEYRDTTNADKKRSQIAQLEAQNRISNNAMSQLLRERKMHDDQVANLRVGFQDSLEKTRDRFEEAAKKEREAREMGRSDFRSSVDQRVNNQIRSLENENEDLKHANSVALLKQRQEEARERTNLLNSFKKNIDAYEKERQETKNLSQEQHAEDLHELQRRNDEIINASSKFYMGRMREENFRNKSALNQLEMEKKTAMDQSEMLAQKRVDVILKDTEDQISTIRKHQQTSLEVMKDDYLNEKTELVESLTKEKEMALQRMQDEIKKTEIESARSEAALRLKFKNEMAEANARHTKDKRLSDNHNKKVVNELVKANQEALEMQQLKFKNKVEDLNEQHRNELDRLRSNHRAQMDSVLSAVKQTQS
ncbi:MAG: hypothetical protein KDD61_13615 [Bdellovibrionales bacterium]|nr:hypothetical protein [Bdellovibrionales bacterium]